MKINVHAFTTKQEQREIVLVKSLIAMIGTTTPRVFAEIKEGAECLG